MGGILKYLTENKIQNPFETTYHSTNFFTLHLTHSLALSITLIPKLCSRILNQKLAGPKHNLSP